MRETARDSREKEGAAENSSNKYHHVVARGRDATRVRRESSRPQFNSNVQRAAVKRARRVASPLERDRARARALAAVSVSSARDRARARALAAISVSSARDVIVRGSGHVASRARPSW